MERNKLIINIIPIRPSGGRCIGDMQRPMILLNGKHVIAYTSVSEYADHDETVVRQTQSIAVGDGKILYAGGKSERRWSWTDIKILIR